MRIPRLNPAVPLSLKPGVGVETTFHTGEIFPAAGTAGAPRAMLRLQFKRPPGPEALAVHLNGTVLSGAVMKGEWIELGVPPGLLRTGTNTVRLELAAGAAPAVWTDLHCTVRPSAAVSPRGAGARL